MVRFGPNAKPELLAHLRADHGAESPDFARLSLDALQGYHSRLHDEYDRGLRRANCVHLFSGSTGRCLRCGEPAPSSPQS